MSTSWSMHDRVNHGATPGTRLGLQTPQPHHQGDGARGRHRTELHGFCTWTAINYTRSKCPPSPRPAKTGRVPREQRSQIGFRRIAISRWFHSQCPFEERIEERHRTWNIEGGEHSAEVQIDLFEEYELCGGGGASR